MISGIGNTFLPAPITQRDTLDLQDQQRRETEQRERLSPQGDVRSEPQDPDAFQRRIEALQASDEGRLQRQREQSELPLESQQALNLYQANQAGSRDESELVGVDIFV